MAHQIAGELDVSPWDALLGEVRRTAWRVGWLDDKLATAADDEELVGRGALAPFERMQRAERMHLARVSKLAIDAGIAARMVAQIEEDGRAIAGVLLGTLGELGLSEADTDRARGILRRRLLELDSGTIEGTWRSDGDETVQGQPPTDAAG